MLYRKSIIAFWHYCSVETFQLLIINEINPSFWNGQSIFHLEILLKSFQNYQSFFFSFSKGHWPFTRQSMSVNPPFLLLCFKDKEIWSLYFFCVRVIFLCFWQNTYFSVPDAILKCSLAQWPSGRSVFFFFSFLFQMDHKFELWVPLKSLLFLWG